jgi:UPF0042 nucleotide-binding protein
VLTPKLVIVTGLSGAGKTQAVRSLEDIGFFCVDNLPPTLIPKFADLCAQAASSINKIALVVDIRGGEFFDTLFEVLADLDARGIRYEILFLEASDETLVRRFKESRRRHPLSMHGEVLEGIREERNRLRELRGRANKIIDTSDLTVLQLKEEINGLFADSTDTSRLFVTIISFGFKYGVPLDSDLVMDVRFLPNPHYDPSLRPFTGNDPAIRDFVFNFPVTAEFTEKFSGLVEFLIPHYIKEGKTTLQIAIGCTGGRHRSVALANQLEKILRAKDFRVAVRHRDIKRA